MNKPVFSIFNILSICLLVPGFALSSSIARGDYVEKEMTTQINEQTDLFDKSINDYAGFTNKLEQGKQAGIDSLGGENGTPQGLQYISKENKSQLTRESQKLESIHENDLASKGRQEMIKEGRLHKLYPDHNRPGYKQHLQDAKTIAKAQDELLKNLLEKLKALGVDCKTVKGDKKVEPEYFLQTKISNHKDTVYNQVFCEEPRNKYSCRDSVSLTCKRKGKRYGEWEERTIELSGPWIHWNRRWWTYAIKWKEKRFGIHLYPNWQRSDVANSIRDHIVETLGVSDEQIHKEVNVSARGEGAINHIDGKGYIWERFRIGYKYRSSTEICEQWSEDWNERCYIK